MAVLLTKVKSVCDMNMDGQKVKDCVIAVPHYFTDAQRRGLLDAAKIAGLNPLRLINETTAIALQYGMGRPIPEPRKVLFYDTGVCSTDVSLITISGTGLKVEAVASDRCLGGRDIDEALAHHMAVHIKEKYKLDVTTNQKAWLKLRKEADRVKQTLSANTKVPYTIEYIMDGRDVAGVVTREELNDLIEREFKARLIAPLQYVIDKSGVKMEEIHSIELLGGCTRIPYIQALLKDAVGCPLAKTCDADESVCRGATLQCAMLSPSFKVKEYEIKEVAPYAIEVEWLHDANARTNNGAIPAFTTEDRVRLIDLYAPTPAVKIVTIKETKLPLLVAAKYVTSGQPSFPAAEATLTRCLITAPADAKDLPEVLKLKLKVKLDASGVGSLTEAVAVREVDVEVEEEVPVDAAAPAEGDAAMTDADKPVEKKMVKVMRKQLIKTPLTVTAYYPYSLDERGLKAATEQEIEMANHDRLVHETNEAKNELEGYILNMRPRIQDKSDLGKYFTEAAVNEFVDRLRAEEEWLDDEGYDETKDVYVKRLSELKALGADALLKEKEREFRGETYEKFLAEVNRARQWANTTEEAFSHIPAEEREKLNKKCDDLVNTVSAAMSAQNARPDTEPLAITVAQLQAYTNEIIGFARSIMNKPKPRPVETPKPTETPKPAETPKEEAPKAEEEAPKAEEMADEPKTDGEKMEA